MEMYQMLWIVFPYTVLAIVGMGLIWQLETPGGGKAKSTSERFFTESLKWLLVLCTLTGLVVIHLYDEIAQLFLWFLSFIQLQPDMSLIKNISFLSQIHIVIVFLFLLSLAFSNKICYLSKPHLYIKELLLKLHLVRRHL
ncbi:MAG: respiratory nitrate reductase subunit gamma [Bacillota bacterium]